MKIAIVGDDPRLLDQAGRLVADGHSLTFIDVPPLWDLSRFSQGAEVDGTLAAAVCGGETSSAIDAASRIAMRLPALILPSAQQAAQLAYRLVLHAEDGGLIVPAFSRRFEPAVRELLKRFIQGELGDLQLVRMERIVAVMSGADALLTRDRIDTAFFDDVDLLRLFGGAINRVTTMLVGAQHDRAVQAIVTLGSDTAHEASWTLSSGDSPRWQLTLTGSKAVATLSQQQDKAIRLRIGDQDVPAATGNETAIDECLREFLNRVQGTTSDKDRSLPVPDWSDYVQAYDILEGMNRSIRRRRTIDLQRESVSERNQFKSQMTAIGCGVLMWTFFGTMMGLMLGQFLDPRDPLERRAAAAGTILWEDDFSAGESTPQQSAIETVLIGLRQDQGEGIVLIEQSRSPADESLDIARRTAVQEQLQQISSLRVQSQVDVRVLQGRWFRRAMLVVWTIVFAPLGAYLLLQLLISFTRSGSGRDTLPTPPQSKETP